MIGLLICIIVILLIVLIVVAMRSSETCVEPFSALSGDNYATGLYLSKVLCGQHLDKMIEHIFINNVSLIDYLIPNGMILACTNDLSVLPMMVNWEGLKSGYFLRSSSKEKVGTIDSGTTIGSHGNILNKGINVKYNDTGVHSASHDILYASNTVFIVLNNPSTTRDEPPSVSIAFFKKQSSKQHETCPMSVQTKSITIDSSSIFDILFGIGFVMFSTNNNSWANMKKKTFAHNDLLFKTDTRLDMSINNTNSKGWKWLTTRTVDSGSTGGMTFLKSFSTEIHSQVNNTKIHELNNTPVTNFPLTRCVNIFSKATNRTASKKSVDETDEPIESNWIKGMKMGTLTDIHTESITGKDGKNIINGLYPIGTVLLFMVDIDLSKQWPGTTWELFEGYIGTSKTTEPGAVFGVDEIKLIDASNPPLKIKDTKAPMFLGALRLTYSGSTVDKFNTQSFSNKLPHYCIRAYRRTG